MNTSRIINVVRGGLGLVLVLSAMAGIAQATPPIFTPEIDPGSMVSALTLFTGGMLVLNGRRRKA